MFYRDYVLAIINEFFDRYVNHECKIKIEIKWISTDSNLRKEACVDCGLCKLTCPVINYTYEKRKEYSNAQVGYAARNKDYNQRLISSSGSIFPVLAEYILERKGLVVGIAYDNYYNAEPCNL